jgi:hypothetical protein
VRDPGGHVVDPQWCAGGPFRALALAQSIDLRDEIGMRGRRRCDGERQRRDGGGPAARASSPRA